MSVKELIKNEVDRLPENLLVEMYDFMQFLEVKKEIFSQRHLKNCLPHLFRKFGITKRMLYMTIYKGGDVILVSFPFSDQSTSKKRPAVIISSDRYNKLSSDVIIMAITSKTQRNDCNNVPVDFTNVPGKRFGSERSEECPPRLVGAL